MNIIKTIYAVDCVQRVRRDNYNLQRIIRYNIVPGPAAGTSNHTRGITFS